MTAAKKVLGLMRNFIAQVIVFLACSGIAFTQGLNTGIKDSSFKASATSFYKTDSIFSLRSSKGYFPSLISNFGKQATAPLHFKVNQWLLTGSAIGVTILLIENDGDIDDWAKKQNQQQKWVNKVSPVLTEFGGTYGIATVGTIGVINVVFSNKKGVETVLLATQAMITSGVWVQLIKQVTGRERPKASYENSRREGGQWYGPLSQYDQDLAIKKPGSSFDAFPSGHTATAFAIATVFASKYNQTPIIPIISYSAAALVGATRLTEHQHWASDVFAGAFLGYICGRQVVKQFNKNHGSTYSTLSHKQNTKPEFALFQKSNQLGFSLKW